MTDRDVDPIATVIFLIAIIFAFSYLIFYLIAITLQPLFIALTFVSGIALIAFGFLWYQDEEDYAPLGFAISLLVLVLSVGGWCVTANIIQTVTSSPEGNEQIEMFNTITGVPEVVYATLDKALQQQIEELCKTTDQNTCVLMRNSVKTYKDLVEIKDLVDQGKKYADIAHKIEETTN